MLQRIVPFAIKTFVVLMGAAWLVPLAAVHAQTTVNYNFEDGVMRGTPTQMKVPPKIITEPGNKFVRITGSTGDCQSVPASLCPKRNRSTVTFTSHYSQMPLISSSNMRQTYSANIRFREDTGLDGSVFELYQGAPGGESGGYGSQNGTGPVVVLWRAHGKVMFNANYANETKRTTVERVVPAGSWHNYKVVAVWSHDPAVGRLEFYFDNVKAGPSGGASPAPSVALSAPANVRVVSAQ